MFLSARWSDAVFAMGTGLGVGMILCKSFFSAKNAANMKPEYSVMPLEAGHCLVPESVHKSDRIRNESLSERIYQSKHGIEFEDICSGRGLKACYEYEMKEAGLQIPVGGMDSEQIAKYVLHHLSTADKDASPELMAARKAMTVHYSCLMKAAQNVCVMVPACKGLFFAGDNQVANHAFFEHNQDLFREQFLDHPKRHWLEGLKAYRQTNEIYFNLAGAMWVSRMEILGFSF